MPDITSGLGNGGFQPIDSGKEPLLPPIPPPKPERLRSTAIQTSNAASGTFPIANAAPVQAVPNKSAVHQPNQAGTLPGVNGDQIRTAIENVKNCCVVTKALGFMERITTGGKGKLMQKFGQPLINMMTRSGISKYKSPQEEIKDRQAMNAKAQQAIIGLNKQADELFPTNQSSENLEDLIDAKLNSNLPQLITLHEQFIADNNNKIILCQGDNVVKKLSEERAPPTLFGKPPTPVGMQELGGFLKEINGLIEQQKKDVNRKVGVKDKEDPTLQKLLEQKTTILSEMNKKAENSLRTAPTIQTLKNLTEIAVELRALGKNEPADEMRKKLLDPQLRVDVAKYENQELKKLQTEVRKDIEQGIPINAKMSPLGSLTTRLVLLDVAVNNKAKFIKQELGKLQNQNGPLAVALKDIYTKQLGELEILNNQNQTLKGKPFKDELNELAKMKDVVDNISLTTFHREVLTTELNGKISNLQDRINTAKNEITNLENSLINPNLPLHERSLTEKTLTYSNLPPEDRITLENSLKNPNLSPEARSEILLKIKTNETRIPRLEVLVKKYDDLITDNNSKILEPKIGKITAKVPEKNPSTEKITTAINEMDVLIEANKTNPSALGILNGEKQKLIQLLFDKASRPTDPSIHAQKALKDLWTKGDKAAVTFAAQKLDKNVPDNWIKSCLGSLSDDPAIERLVNRLYTQGFGANLSQYVGTNLIVQAQLEAGVASKVEWARQAVVDIIKNGPVDAFEVVCKLAENDPKLEKAMINFIMNSHANIGPSQLSACLNWVVDKIDPSQMPALATIAKDGVMNQRVSMEGFKKLIKNNKFKEGIAGNEALKQELADVSKQIESYEELSVGKGNKAGAEISREIYGEFAGPGSLLINLETILNDTSLSAKFNTVELEAIRKLYTLCKEMKEQLGSISKLAEASTSGMLITDEIVNSAIKNYSQIVLSIEKKSELFVDVIMIANGRPSSPEYSKFSKAFQLPTKIPLLITDLIKKTSSNDNLNNASASALKFNNSLNESKKSREKSALLNAKKNEVWQNAVIGQFLSSPGAYGARQIEEEGGGVDKFVNACKSPMDNSNIFVSPNPETKLLCYSILLNISDKGMKAIKDKINELKTKTPLLPEEIETKSFLESVVAANEELRGLIKKDGAKMKNRLSTST